MDEGQENIERLLEDIHLQLKHMKWIMLAGLVVMSVLLLTVIALTFLPVAGLALAAFLIITPTAYLYYVFVSTAQQRETRLRRTEKKEPVLRELPR